MKTCFAVLSCLLLVNTASAQGSNDEKSSSFSYGYTFQPRVSFFHEATENENSVRQWGFGIRRALFRFGYELMPNLDLYAQIGNTRSGAYFMQDLRVTYNFDEVWSVRGGRFNGAQPRGAGLTGHLYFDILDRALPFQYWRDLRGGVTRDFGIELVRNSDTSDWRLFASNGDGRYDEFFGNLRREAHEAGNDVSFAERTSFNLSFSYKYKLAENVETGGYGGLGTDERRGGITSRTGYQAASVHFYYGDLPGSKPWRVKAEVVGWSLNEDMIEQDEGEPVRWGGSFTAAKLLTRTIELTTTFEAYQTGLEYRVNQQTMISLAGQYSFSAARGGEFYQNRVVMAAQLLEAGDNQRLFALITQFQFSL